MDRNGNKWHGQDPLKGTAGEGIQYHEGWGFDGFGDMSDGGGGGGGGGHISYISATTHNGVAGYVISWGLDGTHVHDHTLQGVNIAMRFVAGSDNRNSETFNNINGVSAGVAGGIESFNYSSVGSNFRRYSSGWGGNQYVRTIKIAKIARGVGWLTVGVGAITDVKGVYNYYRYGAESQNAVSPENASLNLTMGVVGMEGGPPGWTISTIYFTIGATIGWENAIPSYISVEKNKSDMREKNISTFSDFKF